MKKTEKITIELQNKKKIKLELYPETAPVTVSNFIALVNSGFYNGLTFHRVIPGFMIQGGCPLGNGIGGSEKKIVGEFKANGFENPLAHKRGTISMARSSDPNSASSQFFIMHKDSPHLDGQYAAFGKVTEGIENVDEITKVETDYADKPLEPVVIEKITSELRCACLENIKIYKFPHERYNELSEGYTGEIEELNTRLKNLETGVETRIVADYNDMIIGEIYIMFKNDNIPPAVIPNKRAYLYGFSVRKELRGFGIGTELLKEAVRLCNMLGYIEQTVAVEKNCPVTALYEKVGFRLFLKDLEIKSTKFDLLIRVGDLA